MAVKLASDEYLKLKKEVSRQAHIAQQRMKRLEEKGWTDSPAYQKWWENGHIKFSVKGKDYNELEKEYARVMEYNNSLTSSASGYTKVLKETAKNTGIQYNDLEDLKSKLNQFFELSNEIENYLNKIEGSAFAIGYQKIWEAINDYVKDSGLDLSDTNMNVEEMSKTIGELTKYELVAKGYEGYSEGTEFEYF